MKAAQLGLFVDDTPAIDDAILAALSQRPIVAFSISGGKDSTVAMRGAWDLLDSLGHPREDRLAIHADLGRIEWQSTPETVKEVASYFGARLEVVRHGKHDMISRWEARFAAGKQRYADLSVLNLVGPWSSAKLRFCTAEMKQQVISPALSRLFPGRTIISVVGIRRQESPGRALAPISKEEPRWARADGTRHLTWHPALYWSVDDVFRHHERYGLPLSDVYTVWRCARHSCSFCVMQSEDDQRAAARAPGNRGTLHHLVDMEGQSTFSFQPSRWLGDAAPDLLPAGLRVDLARSKLRAGRRRALEGALPADLRYVKIGWPQRVPTLTEAMQLVATRREILAHHELPELYPTPEAVIGRFRELLEARA